MPLRTVDLLGVKCRWRNPAQHIDAMRYGLKMVRIYTMAHPTYMVQFQPIWYGTDEPFI